ncbi:MAG: hypothetical protein NT056_08100, partial [Proteobacteria bacterium]|nr:hypothetical protein [Pseudomonadota bacterium]
FVFFEWYSPENICGYFFKVYRVFNREGKNMKKAVIAILTAGLLAAGCSYILTPKFKPINTKDSVKKGEGFQPLEAGRSWLYTGKAGGMFDFIMAMQVQGNTEDADGKNMVVMAVKTKSTAGYTNNTVYMVQDGDAVKVMRSDTMAKIKKGLGVEGGEVGIVYAPPKTEMLQKMKVGDKWTDTYKQLGDIDMTYKTGFSFDQILNAMDLDKIKAKSEKEFNETKTVLAGEKVTVPFGTFDALKIESHPNESQTFYSWYAEGYGLVKQTAVQDGKEVLSLNLLDMDSATVGSFFGKGLADYQAKFEWIKKMVDEIRKQKI